MKAQVADIGKHEKSVTIEIPPDQVDAELNHVVSDIRKSANIQGFRKGKAPESVILRMYADYIDSHAKEHLVSESLPDVLEKEEIVPVSEPVIDAPKVARGAAFTYTARFEVRPAVTAKGYTGLTLKKPNESVPESDIDERLEQLRQQHAQYRGLPDDHVSDLGDTLVCQYQGTIGDQQVGTEDGKDLYYELGSRTNLPGLDEKLKGAKAGEHRHVEYTLPEDLENKEMAGKHVHLHVEIKSLRRKELPKLDDDFAKDLESEGLDDLKKKIREQFETQAKDRARRELADEAAKLLVEKNEIELPPSMVERQMHQMFQATQQRLAMQGLNLNLGHGESEEIRESLRADATRALQKHLLLESIAKQEKIEVSEEKVESQIKEMAQAMGQPYEKVRAVYDERGLTDQIRSQLLQDAALDFVLEKAKIS